MYTIYSMMTKLMYTIYAHNERRYGAKRLVACTRPSRTRGASPCSHRVYRFVDGRLSELNARRDDLRRETRMEFENADERTRVNQQMREAEEKLSAVRQKQCG